MLEKLKKPGLILGLLGAAKLVLDNFGIQIPDELINQIANGVSALLVLMSILVDHGKQEEQQQ